MISFVYAIIKRSKSVKVMLAYIYFQDAKRCLKHPEIDASEVEIIG